jgi:hypothetical protein
MGGFYLTERVGGIVFLQSSFSVFIHPIGVLLFEHHLTKAWQKE